MLRVLAPPVVQEALERRHRHPGEHGDHDHRDQELEQREARGRARRRGAGDGIGPAHARPRQFGCTNSDSTTARTGAALPLPRDCTR